MVQDKDAKVTYLQKIIDVVGIVLGEHVPAKPLKVRCMWCAEGPPGMLFQNMASHAFQIGRGQAQLHAMYAPMPEQPHKA